MFEKKFLKLEYSILLIVIIGILILLMPVSIENSRQASLISKWNTQYNRVEYMFSVINTHINDDKLLSMKRAQSTKEREKILLMIIKPYLRINTDNIPSKRYRPKLMDGTPVTQNSAYYFKELYFAENNTIVGIKNIKTNKPEDVLFVMMFDENGLLPPNRWGKDIFGIRIYDGGKIKPFGEDLDMDKVKEDCSKKGTGGACSYYYKIGGGFDE